MPRRPQKSRARNPGIPLKKAHYRQAARTPKLNVVYPALWQGVLDQLGPPRCAAKNLAMDTKRWFQRGPEQLVIAAKNLGGQFILELSHQIRRPDNDEPFYTARVLQADGTKKTVRKRKADQFHQHTQPYLYDLNDNTHARAFRELLNYSIAFVSGYDDPGRFTLLYQLKIGETQELARWPIDGLHRYNEKTKQILPVKYGYEILEAVCGPGERARKPKTLCGPRPEEESAREHYDGVKEHWHKQVKGCQSKETKLRLRRVYVANKNGHTKPAFFLNAIYDFDLSLHVIRRLAAQFPAWWTNLYREYELHAHELPRPLYQAQICGTWREDRDKPPHQPLSGPARAHRQPRWDKEIVADWLHPAEVEQLCQKVPQPGLFVTNWVADVKYGSPEYWQRVAFWQAGYITWNPKWSVKEGTVRDDARLIRQYCQQKLTRLVYVFLLLASLKAVQYRQGRVYHDNTSLAQAFQSLHRASAPRAPPPTISNHTLW